MAKSSSPATSSTKTTKQQPADEIAKTESKPEANAADSKPATKTEAVDEKKTTNAPLAPPPRPSQAGTQNSSDYFGGGHNNTHFSLEPNPFEQSFGQPSSDAPRTLPQALPSVSSLTSPATLGPGATPDWQNSLRVGPLSPAMLTGPTTANGGDYFDSAFRQSFPTPNESSMRSTGLTPGGPSMFPAPSPNSQALYNVPSGGATPGTLDFHRTALNAKARMSDNSQGINKSDYQPAQQSQSVSQSHFGPNNSESDAVNSLFMLANNGQRNPNQFSLQQQTQGGVAGLAQMRGAQGRQSMEHPQASHRSQHHSVGGMSASTGSGMDGYGSDISVDAKPVGKKGGKKGAKAANGRRKQDDTPVKGHAGKKSKGNNGMPQMPDMDDEMDDEEDMGDQEIGPNGKKLTDEEKRKNFLERNRVAALKCRQRKKQWLANLQAKVEIFTTENDALTNQLAQMREENQNLKALLIQHKDCAVSHSQGLGGNRMASVLGITAEFDGPNAYDMGMGQPGMMMQQQHQGR